MIIPEKPSICFSYNCTHRSLGMLNQPCGGCIVAFVWIVEGDE